MKTAFSCYHIAMNDFLRTEETIGICKGMGMFSIGHVFWILLFFIALFLIKHHRSKQKGLSSVIAILIAADEIIKHVSAVITGQWTCSLLPLHICSLSVFAVILHRITGKRIIAEYLYAVSLPTALMALAFPEWASVLPFCNIMSIHSFSIHILIALYPCLLLYGGFRPSAKSLQIIIPFIAVMMILMHFLNNALGTDFFFINGGGKDNPLKWIEAYAGSLYLLAFPVLATICWIPMYGIPCIMREKAIAGKQSPPKRGW